MLCSHVSDKQWFIMKCQEIRMPYSETWASGKCVPCFPASLLKDAVSLSPSLIYLAFQGTGRAKETAPGGKCLVQAVPPPCSTMEWSGRRAWKGRALSAPNISQPNDAAPKNNRSALQHPLLISAVSARRANKTGDKRISFLYVLEFLLLSNDSLLPVILIQVSGMWYIL